MKLEESKADQNCFGLVVLFQPNPEGVLQGKLESQIVKKALKKILLFNIRGIRRHSERAFRYCLSVRNPNNSRKTKNKKNNLKKGQERCASTAAVLVCFAYTVFTWLRFHFMVIYFGAWGQGGGDVFGRQIDQGEQGRNSRRWLRDQRTSPPKSNSKSMK